MRVMALGIGALSWRSIGLIAFGAAILSLIVAMIVIRSLGHDTVRWHVDPLGAERTGEPNDYMVLPLAMATDRADRPFPTSALTADKLMARFDAVAMAAPRVERIAGTPEGLLVTYVQRSAVFGFPDYISVRAIDTQDGAALAIWSRSRLGYADLGANRERIEDWLGQL